MPFYETTFIARQDSTEASIDKLIEATSHTLSNHQGRVLRTENWGLRKLAYKIKKNTKGHYIFLCIDAPPEAINEMKRKMLLSEEIIRFLIVCVPSLSNHPSPMMQLIERRKEEQESVEVEEANIREEAEEQKESFLPEEHTENQIKGLD